MKRVGRPYKYRGDRSGDAARVVRRVALTLVFAGAAWFGWLYHEIQWTARHNMAQPADAIAVFGAAEYVGHPSPVLHARLDHAVTLYREQMAPVVITLGGNAGVKDEGTSEGAAGRDYLLANGVPYGSIVAETRSTDTEQQAERLAEIARAHHLHRIIVVSDGTHLFRISEMCKAQGLEPYPSPRPALGHIGMVEMWQRIVHEMLSYTAWRLHRVEAWLGGLV
jgi:uncharacterized SAM-binding protein YcdF (DUF218 family)